MWGARICDMNIMQNTYGSRGRDASCLESMNLLISKGEIFFSTRTPRWSGLVIFSEQESPVRTLVWCGQSFAI